MAVQHITENLALINADGLTFIEREGQLFFSSEEIGKHLGFKNPAKSVNIIFSRNQKELDSYAVGIKLMSTDGKYYQVRHFTEEGVYIISMLAGTAKAQMFRAKIAKLLREVRERQIHLAREAGYVQGRDEALALPQAEAARKQAYLQGLHDGVRQQRRKDSGELCAKIVKWRAQGLSWRECATLAGYATEAAPRKLVRRMAQLVQGVC